MKFKKIFVISVVLALAAIVFQPVLASSEENEAEMFISDTGVFSYLEYPGGTCLPEKFEYMSQEGLESVYYAKGRGITVAFGFMKGLDQVFVTNYETSEGEYDQFPGYGELISLCSLSFRLNYVSDTELEMVVEPDPEKEVLPLYGTDLKVTLTRADVLKEQAQESGWTGAYFCDQLDQNGAYADRTNYISIVQIYGTGDYLLVSQSTEYGQDMGYASAFFVTENGDYLEHVYPGGVVSIEDQVLAYGRNENGDLVTNVFGMGDGFSDTYIRCSSRPMWKEG